MAPEMATTSLHYILETNIGNEIENPKDLFSAGRIAVGSATTGQLKTPIDHEEHRDGIDMLMEDGGHLIWTQMGHPAESNGRVQSAKLDRPGIPDIYKPGEIHTRKQVVVDKVKHKLDVCDREGLRHLIGVKILNEHELGMPERA